MGKIIVMARKLASIVRIAVVSSIPDADRLEVIEMEGKGWRVVTAKGEFRPGDLAVYFEIDSYLPSDDERYAFLRERCLRKFVSKGGSVLREGLRIKTVKLRGVVSQGLVMPLTKFPELTDGGIFPEVGRDVTAELHVDHFDEVAEAMRPVEGGMGAADVMGPFPGFIPKTDEERIQNLAEYFTTMRGRLFEVTEKNDGTSVTMFYAPSMDEANPFGVCTRNQRLKPPSDDGNVSLPWRVARKCNAETAIRAACASTKAELAFQGELVGPGVNANRDFYRDWEWHVFRIWNISAGSFLPPGEARKLCAEARLQYVPVIAESMDVFDKMTDMDALLAFAEGKTARGNEREGLVFKAVDAPYVSFKAVSNRYLLKNG